MNKVFYIILVCVALLIPAGAHATLFPYPAAPDSMTSLSQRCNYVVSRFWERCNFDQAMRQPADFNASFGDWISLMSQAEADTVYTSIDRLLSRFAKKGGKETLALGTMAREWLYSDTAMRHSEELVLPFVRAVAKHKKIDKADRAPFIALQKILESSSVGANVPDIKFTRPDGSKASLADVKGSSVLIFFGNDDTESMITRIRFSTDPDTKALIERGELTLLYLTPGEATDAWKKSAADYPSEWIVGAMPDAAEYFDIKAYPQFYFLNAAHKVLAKDLSANYLLGAFKATNQHKK